MHDFEAIVRDHHPIIYKICRVYAPAGDFDDLYQEALVSVWQGLKGFRGQAKLSTWLYRVVLNTALTYQRNTRRRPVRQGLEDLPEGLLAAETTTPNDRLAHLYAAIRRLKPDERSLILLYLEEKKHEEIAEIMGISANNVAVRVSRLKKKLFQLMKPQAHG